MKLREWLGCVALGVLGAVVVLMLGMACLWLYDQPAQIRNTVVVVVAALAVMMLAGIFGADYIKRRKRR